MKSKKTISIGLNGIQWMDIFDDLSIIFPHLSNNQIGKKGIEMLWMKYWDEIEKRKSSHAAKTPHP